HLLYKIPIFPSNSSFPRLCADCLLKIKRLFSFLSMANYQNRHSFPTRRSSDLVQRGARERRLSERVHRGGHHQQLGDSGVHLGRSEEHTSELQSPYDLVCRLLLEKKNKLNRLISILPMTNSKNSLARLVLMST